jgi:23S rRNA G2069 N7-methylase RlmK/C1962 C5-methylase RlmI
MKFTRFWAMPSANTFDIPPIGDLVKRYLRESKVSVDPFARDKRWATYTNDLNPETAAECHMDAIEFLGNLKASGVSVDLIIFDPPYSVRQIQEVYAGVGMDKSTFDDCSTIGHWAREKDLCYDILSPGGIFIHCGWHSNGMGKGRDMEIIDGLLVAHGRCHNDTIVTVERKIAHQDGLFAEAAP